MINEDYYAGNIEKLTLDNNAYRKVLFTTPTQQLVIMSLLPNQEIGEEVHEKTTQFIRIESGTCLAIINDKEIVLKDNDFIVISPNTKHNIINISNTPLKLYTIYSPPEHKPNTFQQTKPFDKLTNNDLYLINKLNYQLLINQILSAL